MKKMIILSFALIATGCWVRETNNPAYEWIDSGFIYQKDGDYCFTSQSLMKDNKLIDLESYSADINGGESRDNSPSFYEKPPKSYLSSCIPLSQLDPIFTSALNKKEGKVKFHFRLSKNKDSGYRPPTFNFAVSVCKKKFELIMRDESDSCSK